MSATFEEMIEDHKDAVVNAVLVGQSNPRLGDMQDANRKVDETVATLLKYDADSHAKHSASEIRWMNIVTGLKERIKELEGR